MTVEVSSADLFPPLILGGANDAALPEEAGGMGTRVSPTEVELFVAEDAAEGLLAPLRQHAGSYIALHDLCASTSHRLLHRVGAAAGVPVQRLVVRRRSQGQALARLHFVELPLADGERVRIYASDAAAETGTPGSVAKVLLAHARLGVLIAGDVKTHALADALNPLREAIAAGPWSNAELLLVPQGPGHPLIALTADLARASTPAVHIAPQALNSLQVWTFIAGTWNRVLGGTGESARALPMRWPAAAQAPSGPAAEEAAETLPPSGFETPTVPMPMHWRELSDPLPAVAGPAPWRAEPAAAAAADAAPAPRRAMPSPGSTSWVDYLQACTRIKGAVACCVFDTHSGDVIGTAGSAKPPADRLAAQGAALLAQMDASARALGLPAGPVDAAVHAGGHHLLLRTVPGHPGVALHLVISARVGNPTLAAMALQRIDPPQ